MLFAIFSDSMVSNITGWRGKHREKAEALLGFDSKVGFIDVVLVSY